MTFSLSPTPSFRLFTKTPLSDPNDARTSSSHLTSRHHDTTPRHTPQLSRTLSRTDSQLVPPNPRSPKPGSPRHHDTHTHSQHHQAPTPPNPKHPQKGRFALLSNGFFGTNRPEGWERTCFYTALAKNTPPHAIISHFGALLHFRAFWGVLGF